MSTDFYCPPRPHSPHHHTVPDGGSPLLEFEAVGFHSAICFHRKSFLTEDLGHHQNIGNPNAIDAAIRSTPAQKPVLNIPKSPGIKRRCFDSPAKIATCSSHFALHRHHFLD